MFEMPSEDEFQSFLDNNKELIATIDQWLKDKAEDTAELKCFLLSILNFYHMNHEQIVALDNIKSPMKGWAVETKGGETIH